jgi:hypothetical protein
MKRTAAPIAQERRACARQSDIRTRRASADRPRSSRIIAPIGGTMIPSSDSHWMKKAQTLPAAMTMPTTPRMTASSRIFERRMRDQPVAAL